MVGRPEMAALLEIHLARRNDPDLDQGGWTQHPAVRPAGTSLARTRSFTPRESRKPKCTRNLQLLNNAVTRGLTVEYIRNPNAPAIERSIRIWKTHLLELIFGD